jgi:hypothetical protein
MLKSVYDLFHKAGGSVQIAALLNLNQYTVDRWTRSGIPEKYFSAIIRKYGVTREDLTAVSAKAKRLNK